MKTTIDIADPLLKRAKRLAEKRGTTLKAVLEAALRDLLDAQKAPTGTYRLRTHVFQGRGLQPGLSWDDWTTIRELSYEGRGS